SFTAHPHHPNLHSFPTRRSSDLHGNGTQSIFYDDPSVLSISLHQDNLFPANSGAIAENGEGKGKGFNINVPLPPGSGPGAYAARSEEHTSELQSRGHLVCRLLLE